MRARISRIIWGCNVIRAGLHIGTGFEMAVTERCVIAFPRNQVGI